MLICSLVQSYFFSKAYNSQIWQTLDIKILAEFSVVEDFIWLQRDVLGKIDGMSSETMLLLWSMKEKHNCDLKFKNYFDSLPKEFNTGMIVCFDIFSLG